MQLAEECDTETKVRAAFQKYGSWYAICAPSQDAGLLLVCAGLIPDDGEVAAGAKQRKRRNGRVRHPMHFGGRHVVAGIVEYVMLDAKPPAARRVGALVLRRFGVKWFSFHGRSID